MKPRIPLATYRLQFNKDFRFEDARRILGYLAELGISDLYASPILAARRGSGHGYDVTDPTHLNPELGTEEEFTALQDELQRRGMRIVFDIVPNHMAAGPETPWWMDVLEYGPESAFSSYFDVNWRPLARSLEGKVLLPVLDRPFGQVLDSGDLRIEYGRGKFVLCCGEMRFPIKPQSYRTILNHRIDSLKNYVDPASGPYQEYEGILAALTSLLDSSRQGAASAGEKRVAFNGIYERLRNLTESSAEVARFIADNLAEFNGRRDAPESFGQLEQLLSEQHYKLSYWQNVNDPINYRRFFTISDLVGVRVEDPLVFEATHAALFRLARKETFGGLRVDHIDGLRDPQGYLNRLHDRAQEVLNGSSEGRDPYLLVEKILEPQEQLPVEWPVAGTTGYDYLNAANCLFVDSRKGAKIRAVYEKFIGRSRAYADVLYESKKTVMGSLLAPEMRALSIRIGELATEDRYAREIPRPLLTHALAEVTAEMPVYRTYIRNLDVPPEAAEVIEQAVAAARRRRPDLDGSLDFVRDVLLLRSPPHVPAGQREARLAFVLRWQQLTGPIVAKGMEDTSLYVYYPLASLNEVGGDPRAEASCASRDFVKFLAARSQHWPGSLNASTTHDTKRSEDVRARLDVLSQMPEDWQAALERWAALNQPYKESVHGHPAPDRNEEYLLYQTLLGAWPLEEAAGGAPFAERIQAYMVKAVREAMVHTRWTRPNEPREQALSRFIAALLSGPGGEPFRTDLCAFQQRIARVGMINGLAQTLLKIVCPGVPDFYQGSELWDLRLVDPDNRGPVDFARRDPMLRGLAEAERADPAALRRDLREHWRDGRIKMYLIWKALACRRLRPELFAEGTFASLAVEGKSRWLAFCRQLPESGDACIVVAPRGDAAQQPVAAGVEGAGAEEESVVLKPGMPQQWRNVFTGDEVTTDGAAGLKARKRLAMPKVLGDFPVALLVPLARQASR